MIKFKIFIILLVCTYSSLLKAQDWASIQDHTLKYIKEVSGMSGSALECLDYVSSYKGMWLVNNTLREIEEKKLIGFEYNMFEEIKKLALETHLFSKKETKNSDKKILDKFGGCDGIANIIDGYLNERLKLLNNPNLEKNLFTAYTDPDSNLRINKKFFNIDYSLKITDLGNLPWVIVRGITTDWGGNPIFLLTHWERAEYNENFKSYWVVGRQNFINPDQIWTIRASSERMTANICLDKFKNLAQFYHEQDGTSVVGNGLTQDDYMHDTYEELMNMEYFKSPNWFHLGHTFEVGFDDLDMMVQIGCRTFVNSNDAFLEFQASVWGMFPLPKFHRDNSNSLSDTTGL